MDIELERLKLKSLQFVQKNSDIYITDNTLKNKYYLHFKIWLLFSIFWFFSSIFLLVFGFFKTLLVFIIIGLLIYSYALIVIRALKEDMKIEEIINLKRNKI